MDTPHDEQPHQPQRAEARLPAALLTDLTRLYGAERPVPPEVDEAVLSEAGAVFERIRRRRTALRRLLFPVGAAAAAAVVGIALFLADAPAPESGVSKPGRAPVSVAADIDGNGRVDILDAYHLAVRIDAGESIDAVWDFNGDRVVDRADADAIALSVVALNTGSS